MTAVKIVVACMSVGPMSMSLFFRRGGSVEIVDGNALQPRGSTNVKRQLCYSTSLLKIIAIRASHTSSFSGLRDPE